MGLKYVHKDKPVSKFFRIFNWDCVFYLCFVQHQGCNKALEHVLQSMHVFKSFAEQGPKYSVGHKKK